jgi:hypothetical protein
MLPAAVYGPAHALTVPTPNVVKDLDSHRQGPKLLRDFRRVALHLAPKAGVRGPVDPGVERDPMNHAPSPTRSR